jgi:hypothetical protein
MNDGGPNMKASKKAAAMFTGADKLVARNGNNIWGVLCDRIAPYAPFRTEVATRALMDEFGYTNSTARSYARAVLQSVYDNQDGEDRAVWKPTPLTWVI